MTHKVKYFQPFLFLIVMILVRVALTAALSLSVLLGLVTLIFLLTVKALRSVELVGQFGGQWTSY